MNKIMEKLAAGLRSMKNKPDALLFMDGWEDWTCDEEYIYGIPIYHAESINDTRWESSIENVLFIPIWKEDGTHISDRNNFIDGYTAENPLTVEKRN